MSDPAEPFLTALESTLRGSTGLATAMGLPIPRIYAERPAAAAAARLLPYIQIGDDQIIGDARVCSDDSEIFCTIHVWSGDSISPPGSRMARQIGAVIRSLLKDGISITGHETVVAEYVDGRYLTDPDGSTHGVLTFRYETTPTP